MPVLAVLAAAALAAGAAVAATDQPSMIEGEVVAVHREVAAGDGQKYTEVTVQTRAREQMRLRLGPSGDEPPGVQAGHRIRARLVEGGPQDGAYQVRKMKNQDTATTTKYRKGDGTPIQSRDRIRARDGSCTSGSDSIRNRNRKGRSDTGSPKGRRAGGGGSAKAGRAR